MRSVHRLGFFILAAGILLTAPALGETVAAVGPVASRPSAPAHGDRRPQWPLKTSRTLLTNEQIARARQLCTSDPAARAVAEALVDDAAYWIGKSDEELRELLPDSRVPRAFNVSTQDCPVHGKEIYRFGTYPWKLDRERPFTVICPIDGARFPSNDFEAFYRSGMTDRNLLTGPYADDGRGWAAPSGEKYWLVGYACHWNWRNTWIPAVTTLSRAYVLTGERIYARKALAMLDRVAEVYPGMDHAHQSRYGELMSGNYQGKILNHIWETGVLRDLAVAYDLVFDALAGSDPVALSWRSTEQIRANIEANLLEEGIDAVASGKISGNFGMHQSALASTVIVRQNGPSESLLDGIFSNTGGKQTHEGIDYALYNLVFKDGMPYESSPGYCFSWVGNLLGMAQALERSSYNLFERPKFRRMFDAPFDMVCTGRFTPSVGDAGSTRAGFVGPSAEAYETAFQRYGDPRYAWFAARLGGWKSRQISGFEDLFRAVAPESARATADAYVHKPASRLLDGYGMAILNNPADSLAMAVYYGNRGGHGHYDRLNIELFAHGRRVSPDLGYPDFMNAFVSGIHTWTTHTVSHNCVVVDRTRQSGNLKGNVLRFHDGRHVRVVEIDAPGTYPQSSTYRRALLMVDVDESSGYLVDVFRVRGGSEHVLSLHGQEGEFSLLGESLPAPVTQGTLAGPDVAYGQLYDDPVMNAPGYTGRFSGYKGSGYQHFLNWQRVRPSGNVIGQWTLTGDPPARLRLHVPHATDQEITVADAYVSPTRKVPTILKYMLLGRRAGETGSTFVTVWEMAGEQPIIEAVERTDSSPGGWDQRVELRVLRGPALDRITIVPDTRQPGGIRVDTSTDSSLVRSFVAGAVEAPAGLEQYGGLRGRVDTVDYATRSIRVAPDASLPHTDALRGRMIRIYNDRHTCMYRVAEARVEGGACSIRLEGSDVFTGRVRVDRVDVAQRTVTTATVVLYPDDMPGMRLLTPDLADGFEIVSMRKGVIQLAPGRDLAPLTSLAVSGPGSSDKVAARAAWIADFGPGDRVSMESCQETAR